VQLSLVIGNIFDKLWGQKTLCPRLNISSVGDARFAISVTMMLISLDNKCRTHAHFVVVALKNLAVYNTF